MRIGNGQSLVSEPLQTPSVSVTNTEINSVRTPSEPLQISFIFYPPKPLGTSVALYSQNHYRPVLHYSGGSTADQCYTCHRNSVRTTADSCQHQNRCRPVSLLEPLQTRVSIRTTADPCQYQNHCRPVSVSEPQQTRVSIRTTADPCQYQNHCRPVSVSEPLQTRVSIRTLSLIHI